MKPEDVVRALRVCAGRNCGKCQERNFRCETVFSSAANLIEDLLGEIKRLEALVQPVGRNPCDGCDHGWGQISYKNGKVESKSCMEECQLLKEYLEKQKEGQPCYP